MRSARIDNVFVGDGKYDLCLKIEQLILLQEKTGVGPYVLQQRLMMAEWYVADIIETLRLALIGGGMAPREAYNLVTTYCVEGELAKYSILAYNAIYAALHGAPEEDEEVELPEGDESDPSSTPPTKTDSSDGVDSMSPLDQEESPPAT